MNAYKEDGPRMLRARQSFDPAYCKRSAARASVNDGYIGPRRWGRPRQTLSPRLKLSFGSAPTGPL